MRILGIDPGLRVTGFGLVEQSGRQLAYVTSGRIRTPDAQLPERIKTILEGLEEVMSQGLPDQVAIEKVFVNVNPQSTLLLGQARGAAVCAAISCDLPVSEYSPRSIKQAIVGRGGADKSQVQHMVGLLLGINGPIQNDAADALAVALCHQHTSHTLERMAMMQG